MMFRSSMLVVFSILINACLPSIDPFSGGDTGTTYPDRDPDNTDNPPIPLTEDPLDKNNRFRASDIKKVILDGSYLGTKATDNEEMLVTNVDKDGKEISTLQVEVDLDGNSYKIFLPARLQKVVDIDANFFAILRYKNLGEESADAHIIRKSDGKAWKVSSDAVNPGSFQSLETAGESRIYYTADSYQYQGFDFWKKRSGDSLSLVRVLKDKDEVTLVSIMKSTIDDYALVGVDGVVTSGSFSEDTWISNVTSPSPVPYSLKALSSSFSEYFSANNHAFRLVRAGSNVELRRMDEHPVYGTLVGKIEKNNDDHLYWGIRVGDFFVLKGWSNMIVLNSELSAIVSEPEFTYSMLYPIEIEEKGGNAVLFDRDAICQFRQIGAEVKYFCVKSENLELRGILSAVDLDESGRIFAYSTIESVNDVEKLTIEFNVQTQALEVTKREPVAAYAPEQKVLVPVKI